MLYYSGTVIPTLNYLAQKVDRDDFELDAGEVRGILRGMYIYPKNRPDLWRKVFRFIVDITPEMSPDEIIKKVENEVIPHYKNIGVIPKKDFFIKN